MQTKLFFVFVVMICKILNAQQKSTNSSAKKDTLIRICVPSKSQLLNKPLYMIKILDTTLVNKTDINNINPNWVKSLIILKGSEAINKYEMAAKNGAIEIVLDNEKYPNIIDSIKNGNKH